MKTVTDATNTLLAAGWTKLEAKSVLKPEPITYDEHTKKSPWWTLLDKEELYLGAALVDEWIDWLEHKN